MFRVAGWSSGLLASLMLGCGGPSAELPAPDASEVLSNPVSARADGRASSPDPAARRLLEAMIARYRSATAYADDARVRLAYRQRGQKHVDEAPLSVALDRSRGPQQAAGTPRPDRLHLRAYAAEVVIDDQRLRAAILDPQTDHMDHQRLDRPLADEKIQLADIYSDATLTHFATAGLGGPSPQLELLLSEQPLGGLFDQSTVLRLDRSAARQGEPYDALIIENGELIYKLWIERQTLLLRRVELPPEATGLTANPEISDVRLTIELPAASFTIPASEDWRLTAAPEGKEPKLVQSFVPPPPPLVSPHLGRPVPEFEFLDQDAQRVVSSAGSDREFTVMLWIADHPASQMAARQLQAVADRIASEVVERTRFVLIMAEASPAHPEATGQMLRRWNVGLPYVDDTRAVGRDVFHVREAPTLCVLGPDAVMHWFHPRVGPELADEVPRLLGDLAAGKDVGGELRKQFEADQETYRKLLEEARG